MILQVPNRAHFRCPFASTFPGVCASHRVCLGFTVPKVLTTAAQLLQSSSMFFLAPLAMAYTYLPFLAL